MPPFSKSDDVHQATSSCKRKCKEVKAKGKRIKSSGEDCHVVTEQQFENLTLEDVMCPICLSIFVEPVTLPCQHTLCFQCFDDNVTHTSYTCPLCRVRIGVWVRRAKKSSSLVNIRLWSYIQDNFKEKLEARKSGKDSQILLAPPVQCISAPGEIAEEFELERKKLLEERMREQKTQEEATQEALRKIQLEKLRKEEEVRKLCKKDEEIARQVREKDFEEKKARILGKSPVGTSKKANSSTLDVYLGQLTPTTSGKTSISCQNSQDKVNVVLEPSLSSKTNSLSEKEQIDTFEKNLKNFSSKDARLSKTTPVKRQVHRFSSGGNKGNNESMSTSGAVRSPLKHNDSLNRPTSGAGYTVKRKEQNLGKENVLVKAKHKVNPAGQKMGIKSRKKEAEHTTTDLTESSSRNVTSSAQIPSTDRYLNMIDNSSEESQEDGLYDFGTLQITNPDLLAKMIHEQKAEELRIQQEKEDRKLALQLEKDLKKIDRTKGSEDEYQLRNVPHSSSISSEFLSSPGYSRKISPKNKNGGKSLSNSKTVDRVASRCGASARKARQAKITETFRKRRLSEEY